MITPKTPKFWPNLDGKVHPEADLAVKMLFNASQEHDQAIVALKAQLAAAVIAQTTVTSTTTAATSAAAATSATGHVNNQTDITYAVQDSDYGGLVTLSNAAGVAVTLNPAVRQFWYAVLENLGAGAATLTPSGLGVVNGVASLTLLTNMSAWVFFDGLNWWAATVPVQPITLAAVATKYLTGYDAATGTFSAAQPVESDVAGLTADLASKAPLASPTFTGVVTQPAPPVMLAAAITTFASAGLAAILPANAAGYLTVSINGTTVKIPFFNV